MSYMWTQACSGGLSTSHGTTSTPGLTCAAGVLVGQTACPSHIAAISHLMRVSLFLCTQSGCRADPPTLTCDAQCQTCGDAGSCIYSGLGTLCQAPLGSGTVAGACSAGVCMVRAQLPNICTPATSCPALLPLAVYT